MNREKLIGSIAGLKNIAMGFILGICVMLLTGAGANDIGPYKCCTAGANDAAVFVVDTRDGHTWRLGRSDFYDFGTPDRPISERTSTVPRVK